MVKVMFFFFFFVFFFFFEKTFMEESVRSPHESMPCAKCIIVAIVARLEMHSYRRSLVCNRFVLHSLPLSLLKTTGPRLVKPHQLEAAPHLVPPSPPPSRAQSCTRQRPLASSRLDGQPTTFGPRPRPEPRA